MENLIIIILLLLPTITLSNLMDFLKITETERIIDKYGNKIIDGFNSVVEEVTPLAEEEFSILVKVQIIKGISNLSILLLGLFCLYIYYKYYKEADFCEMDWNKEATVCLVTGIGGLILTIVGLINLQNSLLYIMVPEWYAIKELLYLFK